MHWNFFSKILESLLRWKPCWISADSNLYFPANQELKINWIEIECCQATYCSTKNILLPIFESCMSSIMIDLVIFMTFSMKSYGQITRSQNYPEGKRSTTIDVTLGADTYLGKLTVDPSILAAIARAATST